MADALKAGSFDDLADSMAGAIDTAMEEEWLLAKDQPLPEGLGQEDRRILFAAVAKGVLRYLHAHRADLVTNVVSVPGSGGSHSHQLAFDLEEKLS